MKAILVLEEKNGVITMETGIVDNINNTQSYAESFESSRTAELLAFLYGAASVWLETGDMSISEAAAYLDKLTAASRHQH